MFCTNCGERLEEGFQFCPVCGQKIERRQGTRESTAGYQGDGRELDLFYYDSVNKNSIQIQNGIVVCKHKEKRVGWSKLEEVVILYLDRVEKFGSISLYLILPGMLKAIEYYAKKNEAKKLEQLYEKIAPYCKHEIQKSAVKAWGYMPREKRQKDICPRCGSRAIQYEKLPDISTTASYFKGVYVTTHEEGKMQARCEECGKKWKF